MAHAVRANNRAVARVQLRDRVAELIRDKDTRTISGHTFRPETNRKRRRRFRNRVSRSLRLHGRHRRNQKRAE
jgi:hypothetical protein